MTEKESFQLLITYLKQFIFNNPGSTIAFEHHALSNSIQVIFVCPNIMNDCLEYLRPIISLDPCHFKRVNKGSLFMATVKTPMNEIIIVAFGITSSNEGFDGWKTFLAQLKTSCPMLKNNHPDPSVNYKKFTFIADRDKCLEEALSLIFPEHHQIHCAVHIRQNV
jgi:hypothetical protein